MGLLTVAGGEVAVAVQSYDVIGVAVLDELVSVAGGQLPVVPAGDDMVSDSPSGAVSQIHSSGLDLAAMDAFEPRAGVERGHVAVGGCDEQADVAGADVGGPGFVGGFEHRVRGAAGDPVVAEAEVEHFGSAFPNASGGCCFGAVDEWGDR